MPFTQAQANCNLNALRKFGAIVLFLGVVEVLAVFDNPYAQSHIGASGMASAVPTLMCLTESVPSVITDWFLYFALPFDEENLNLTIDGVGYRIAGHEPDGMGMSWITLAKAPA